MSAPSIAKPVILIADADSDAAEALARALRRRGFSTAHASHTEVALANTRGLRLDGAVIDLRLGDGQTGLPLLCKIRESHPEVRAVILTAHADIPTAVAAIRLGAVDYLTKPASIGAILAALGRPAQPSPVRRRRKNTLKIDEMKHIRAMMAQTDNNISETARRLGMHRRSLQRKLARLSS